MQTISIKNKFKNPKTKLHLKQTNKMKINEVKKMQIKNDIKKIISKTQIHIQRKLIVLGGKGLSEMPEMMKGWCCLLVQTTDL